MATMGMSVEVTGVDKVLARFRLFGQNAVKAMASGLYKEAEQVMAKSKRLVPVDTGELRRSGHVVPPKVTGSGVEVEMGYGGAAAPYALIVHELPPNRASHKSPTQWKYLEQPFREQANGLEVRMAEHLAKAVK